MADLSSLKQFAELKLKELGLSQKGWTFDLHRSIHTFGWCRFGGKKISISETLAAANSEEQCHDTILHEIAHALAGPDVGHGPLWRYQCIKIGANPNRLYDNRKVEPVGDLITKCPTCGRNYSATDRTQHIQYRQCGHCGTRLKFAANEGKKHINLAAKAMKFGIPEDIIKKALDDLKGR
jgi:predicted SprT family Zn-dependent metalloprotease